MYYLARGEGVASIVDDCSTDNDRMQQGVTSQEEARQQPKATQTSALKLSPAASRVLHSRRGAGRRVFLLMLLA